MKKLFTIALMYAVSTMLIKAQTYYDLYDNLTGQQIISNQNTLPYTGEYEYYFDDYSTLPKDFWMLDSVQLLIENLSFPFHPYCFGNNLCGSSDSIRRIQYVLTEDLFNPNGTWTGNSNGTWTGLDALSNAIFKSLLVYPDNGFNTTSGVNSRTLVSSFHINPFPFVVESSRDLIPNGVIRNTFIFFGIDSLGNHLTDSVPVIIDFTRGYFKHYPWQDDNSSIGSPEPLIYDLLFRADTNSLLPSTPLNAFPVTLHSERKLHFAGYNDLTNDYIIGNPNVNSYDYFNDTATLQAVIPEAELIIQQPIDIAKFNPGDNLIYCPSLVNVNFDVPGGSGIHNNDTLIFPTGHTFKTAPGTYPTHADINAADPDGLYPTLYHVPAQNTNADNPDTYLDEARSVFIVDSGSTIKIEPCVQLQDVDIIVRPGGALVYNANYVDFIRSYVHAGPNATVISNFTFPEVPEYACFFECYELTYYDAEHVTINQNTTWTTAGFPNSGAPTATDTLKIAKELRIKSGSKLTVQNGVRLEFGPNAKLIIEPGGELDLLGLTNDSVVLTSACGLPWAGVRNLGISNVPNSPQSNMALSYAVVENAVVGVRMGKMPHPNDLHHYRSRGGVIQAHSSTFRNNQVDIDFLPYTELDSLGTPISNLSLLQNCRFITTGTLYNTILPKHHVSMESVQGIRFLNCIFENTMANDDVTARGLGIYAMNASYHIKGTNTVNYNSGFVNLTEGIVHLGSSADLLRVEKSKFVGNIRGVTVLESVCALIRDNYFHIPASALPTIAYDTSFTLNPNPKQIELQTYANPVGVHLIRSHGYQVARNEFNNGVGTEGGTNWNYGIVVNSTTDIDNDSSEFYIGDLKLNDFGNLDVGVQVEGWNSYYNEQLSGNDPGLVYQSGLNIKCNRFNQTSEATYDIAVVEGTLKYQGRCPRPSDNNPQRLPANNVFQRACDGTTVENMLYHHIFNNNSSILLGNDYAVYDSLVTITNPECHDVNYVNSEYCQIGVFDFNDACNSQIVSIPSVPHLPASIQTKSIQLDSAISYYVDIIDDGDTEQMLNMILDLQESTGDLTQLLLNASPYLSDTVLVSAFDRTIPFSYDQLFNIVAANSPLSEHAFAELEKQRPMFTEYMFSVMEDWQQGVSARTNLERAVSEWHHEYRMAVIQNEVLYRDSLDFAAYSAQIANHGSTGGVDAMNMHFAMWQSDTTGVNAYLNNHQNWNSYLGYHYLNGGTAWSLNADLNSYLADISSISPASRELLARQKNVPSFRRPLPIDQSSSKYENHTNSPDNYETQLLVYPNPTQNRVTIELRELGSGTLYLYDVFGVLRKSEDVTSERPIVFWELEDLAKGQYIVVFEATSGIRTHAKLIVQ